MNIRPTRFLSQAGSSLVALCGIVAVSVLSSISSARAQSDGEMKTLAIVTLSGYDALMEDVDFIGGLAGQPAGSQMIDGMIQMLTQGQGLVGLDKSRPIGVVIQSDGMAFGGGLCLPVTDFPALLAALEAAGITSEVQGDGVTKISAQGQELFARVVNEWAFLAPMQPMLEGLPDNPIGLFSTLTKDYDIGVRAFVQNIPEAYRQLAISQLQSVSEAGSQPKPGESDEAYQSRKEMTAAQIEQFKRKINELDELTIGICVDSQQQRTFFDVAYTAVEGSELANQIGLNSDPRTNYAGFFQPDAAMMASFATKVTESDIAQMDQMIEVMRKQLGSAIDEDEDLPSENARKVMKSALDDFLDAMKATLQAGVMDGGAVLNLAPDAATFVAGGFVADTSKVESGLKKLVELAKEEPDFPGIQWNSDQHADISFHTLNVPTPEGEDGPRQVFGDNLDMAVGIGQKSVYFALGRDCMAAVKGIIDQSAANPGKSVSSGEITFALGQIMELAASLAEGEDQQKFAMISAMLAEESAGRDHVRIVVQPIPRGLRTRVELEEGVLKAIGIGAAAAQAQPAGAGF